MSYLTPQAEQQGLRRAIKPVVRLASLVNVNLGSTLSLLDNVALADLDRVLLKNQTDPKENGIYVWSGGTQLFTRARDFLSDADIGSGLLITVREGDVQKDSQWQLVSEEPLSLGVSNLSFERAAGKGAMITQLQMFVVGADQVDGVDSLKVSSQFPFNPTDWPPGRQFFFGGVLSIDPVPRVGTLELFNITDNELVTTGTLSSSAPNPAKVESSALTVGDSAGNLRDTEKLYAVRITNDGTLVTEKTILGCAYIRIADG